MKLIYEPSVRLVGRQSVDLDALNEFIADEAPNAAWLLDLDASESDQIPEVAGRICYMSFAKPRPGGNAAYLQNILQSGHGSVLEHAVWNFIISGVSRSFSHELVRHRAGWAYSQLSQRYVDESVAEYVVPHDLQEAVRVYQYSETSSVEEYKSPPVGDNAWLMKYWKDGNGLNNTEFRSIYLIGERWCESVTDSHNSYKSLVSKMADDLEKSEYEKWRTAAAKLEMPLFSLEDWKNTLTIDQKTAMRKQVRQAARSVLPNATETKLFVTVNARAARHFIELRASKHAEPEIRKVAVAMLQILQKESPNLFGDYQLRDLPDGTKEAFTNHRKV